MHHWTDQRYVIFYFFFNIYFQIHVFGLWRGKTYSTPQISYWHACSGLSVFRSSLLPLMCGCQKTQQLALANVSGGLYCVQPGPAHCGWGFHSGTKSILLSSVLSVTFNRQLKKRKTHPQMWHLYSLMPRCLFTWFLASPSWAVAKLQILHMKGLEPVEQSGRRVHQQACVGGGVAL